MSIFTDIGKSIRNGVKNWLIGDDLDTVLREYRDEIWKRRSYRNGQQERQLKVKSGDPDDNLTVNFVGLIADRSYSMLFGKGVKFDLPGEDDAQEAVYINSVWKANKKALLLQKVAVFGSEAGTWYLKIVPGGAIDDAGNLVPRLIALDPATVRIDAAPEDVETVIRYTISYNITGPDGEDTRRKEVIEVSQPPMDEDGNAPDNYEQTWTIAEYMLNAKTFGHWMQIGEPEIWPYEFPPIIHCQNLPDGLSAYGIPDITDDVIELQDRLNFIASNISKIIRYHAHPRTWGRQTGQMDRVNWGPDEMPVFKSDSAMVANLEMQSDLASSQGFLAWLRQSMMDITQTVDISSMADKIGALTNFGLRVLYQDALAKLGIKQELYGEALTEINHRLLELAGFANTNGGAVVWPDPLPKNAQEEQAALSGDLAMGIVSKQTVATKRGYEWSQEEQRIGDEKAAADNIGAALLKAFDRGQ